MMPADGEWVVAGNRRASSGELSNEAAKLSAPASVKLKYKKDGKFMFKEQIVSASDSFRMVQTNFLSPL